MNNLFGQSKKQLQALCEAEGFPRYTAGQLCDWLYAKRVSSIDEMTNLSLKTRARLKEISEVRHLTPVECQVSHDGTKKYLFEVHPTGASAKSEQAQYVEAVFIPDEERGTLCLSSQCGCRMGCRFCATGQQGYHGDLSASEIVGQVIGIPEYERLTNIVFMGMGEPMDNYANVLLATEILTSEWGMGFSPRRITVSSVGITPKLQRFIEESQCHVAVSLHQANSEARQQLMPMEKAYPIAKTIEMLRRYDWTGQRRISFEYTMLAGINDRLEQAAAVEQLLRGLPCRVNLIRYHSTPQAPYKTSMPLTINAFREYLNRHGITCTLRASRGEDIMAACGLLAGKNNDNKK